MGGVVCAARARSQSATDPLGEVAHVDHLRGAFGRAGRENLSTARDAVRPVGEAAGGVVRPDDEPRANDERSLAEHVADGALAERLQRAVALVRHLVVGQVAELGDRAVLVRRRAEVRVDGDARDEAVDARSRRAPRPTPARRAGGSRTCRPPRPTRDLRARRVPPSDRRRCARPPDRAPGSSCRG